MRNSIVLRQLLHVVLVTMAGITVARADEPVTFFDGQTLDNWTTIDGDPVPDGWEVVNGMIHLRDQKQRAGHIVTSEEFGDFELSFEWKIAPGGNSGIKYRVHKYGNRTLGCEYQVYDDDRPHKPVGPRNSAGSLYDLYAPNLKKQLKPAGEFNSARIRVQDDQIDHWLNGKKILTAKVGSTDWNLRVAASKFSENDDFGTYETGRIMLTDHGSEVWYRNVDFKELPADR